MTTKGIVRVWTQATCIHLLCHKVWNLGPPYACFLICKWGCPPECPRQASMSAFTQRVGHRHSLRKHARSGLPRESESSGPSAHQLFIENLLCARHRTRASPTTDEARPVLPQVLFPHRLNRKTTREDLPKGLAQCPRHSRHSSKGITNHDMSSLPQAWT